MSVITTAASASASPALTFHVHGHRKGGHADPSSAAGTGTGSSSQGPTTTEGLFGRLLDSLEQIVGIPGLTSTGAAPATANGNATASSIAANTPANGSSRASSQPVLNNLLQKAQSGTLPPLNSPGVRLNASA